MAPLQAPHANMVLWDPGAGGRGHPGSERNVALRLY